MTDIINIDEAFELYVAECDMKDKPFNHRTAQREPFRAGAKASLLILANRLARARPQDAQQVGDILSGLIKELE